ncbi:outer membrane lipoprotein carrier protein LolA [Streptomyces sp. SID7909]|uniref:LolA family protein n=1 Tax=Streptomyces sp. SID7909 TaxID=2706092 RepID=UPI0013BE673C|nr:outer membrane lipoprotein carrier protein LolA [Streptomyces sp. SID7909]NEC07622.1 outer membrane lipoprotein carrier protein LolA [Streptomyces sp. SID7909]
MAPNDSAETNGTAARRPAGRRKAARYIVPVAVAGVAAATIGLVPALASSGDPDLPKITAQELIEKIAASDTEQFSGTVKISTDLGIPSMGGLAGSFLSGATEGGDGGKGGSSADPQSKLTELASGTHTLRVAADGPDKQRLSVLDQASEYSLIHNGDEVWAYDSGSNEVYHADGRGKAPHGKEQAAPEGVPTTPKALAEEALKAADGTTSVSVDGTARVAGRDAYRLVLKPEQKGSTVGSITVAVDAENGVPLKFTLQPSSGGKAVVDAGFTSVDFGKPAASSFAFTPPKGAKVTEADDAKAEGHQKEARKAAEKAQGDLAKFEGEGAPKIIGKGWNSIAEFKTPGGAALPSEASKDVPAEAQQFLDALGDKVSGKFGSGTVFKTRLINALMTDDGRVYVGAVTKDALVAAANAG